MASQPPPPFKTHEEAALAYPHLRLNRLKEILTLRNQPWTESEFKSQAERNKRTPDPYTEAEIEDVLRKLVAPHIAEAIAVSVACADLKIAKRLFEIHGQIPLEVKKNETYPKTLLNGEPIYLLNQPFLGNAKTLAEMSEAIEWMPTVGLGWMLGLGSESGELYWNSMLSKALEQIRAVEFEGVLPSLVNGRIEQPELLAALHTKKMTSCVPKAYDSILCWVPETKVAEFPDDLIAYKSVQEIVFEDTRKRESEGNVVAVRLIDVDKDLLNDVKNEWADSSSEETDKKKLVFKEVVMRTIPAVLGRDYEGEMLLIHQSNSAIQHGFWDKPGMVLCRTSVDFMTHFELGQPDARNEGLAREYVRSYVPVDLMAKAYGNLDEIHLRSFIQIQSGFSGARNNPVYSFNDLVKRLNTPEPLKSNIRGILSKDIFLFLTSLNGSNKISPTSLSTIYREYGIDNSGVSVDVWASHIEALYQSGFKFSEKTVTDILSDKVDPVSIPNNVSFSTIYMNRMDAQQLQGVYTQAISMGLWPSPVKEPITVTEALGSLTRRKFHTATHLVKGKLPYEANAPVFAYRGYLAVAGVDACALVAKTDAHWKVLAEVFSTDELKPYLDQASIYAKTKMFSKDLGI